LCRWWAEQVEFGPGAIFDFAGLYPASGKGRSVGAGSIRREEKGGED
jgi:hypothetical protein